MKEVVRPFAVGVLSVAAMSALLMMGCSRSDQPAAAATNPPAARTQAAPAGPVTARDAFWPMYKAAHAWAPDVMVLRVTAKPTAGVQNAGGKSAMWEAVFASSSKAKYRTFTYSIADVPPDIYKGVNGGIEMAWSGVTRDAMPVDVSQFSVDSDAAYLAASADAAEWLKKNSSKELSVLEMGDTYKFPEPVWYVMWGTKSAGYAAYVDASTGKVLKR
jgi:hypothetical protein